MARRKMDIDDKKKGFMYGVVLMMLFIAMYFMFIHSLLGGDAAPWQLVDSILAVGIGLSFVLGQLIAKLQTGEDHSIPSSQEGPTLKNKER